MFGSRISHAVCETAEAGTVVEIERVSALLAIVPAGLNWRVRALAAILVR